MKQYRRKKNRKTKIDRDRWRETEGDKEERATSFGHLNIQLCLGQSCLFQIHEAIHFLC